MITTMFHDMWNVEPIWNLMFVAEMSQAINLAKIINFLIRLGKWHNYTVNKKLIWLTKMNQ